MKTVQECEDIARECFARGWEQWAWGWLLNAEALRQADPGDEPTHQICMCAPKQRT